MMKKWKLSQLLLLICLLVTFCLPDTMLYAQNLDNSVNADFQMEGTTLIRYIGTERNVTIPANCTEIGKEAFLSNASLETVTIGNQVEKIGNSAFKNCKNLNKVVIGDYVKEIGKSAFCDAVSLKTVTIGSGVEKIREAAFGGCSSLKAVSVVAANQQISCKYGAI